MVSGFRFESIEHERVSQAAGKEKSAVGFNISMSMSMYCQIL